MGWICLFCSLCIRTISSLFIESWPISAHKHRAELCGSLWEKWCMAHCATRDVEYIMSKGQVNNGKQQAASTWVVIVCLEFALIDTYILPAVEKVFICILLDFTGTLEGIRQISVMCSMFALHLQCSKIFPHLYLSMTLASVGPCS